MATLKWTVNSKHLLTSPILILGFIPASLLFLGLLTINHQSWNKVIQTNTPLLDNINIATNEITQGHLWFEELLTDDKSVRIEDVWDHLNKASQAVDDAIKGESASFNSADAASAEGQLLTHLESLKTSIINLRTVAEDRMQNPGASGVGSELDQRFDLVFKEALGEADTCTLMVHQIIQNRLASQHREFLLLLSLWVFIVAMGSMALLYIEGKRRLAEEALKSRARQKTVIAELGQKALEGTNLESFMEHIVNSITQVLNTNFGKVLELLPDGHSLLLRKAVGWKEELAGKTNVNAGIESQAGYTLLSSHPVIVEDLRQETRFSDESLLSDHGVVSGISVIIAGNPRPFGVIEVHSTEKRTFTEDDINFLQMAANLLGTMVESKQAEAALLKAKEKAENATKIKDKFVAMVTHDLRSPFISIQGFLKLLQDDKEHPLFPAQREMVEHVLDSSNRMLDMTEKLLQLSRLQSGKIELQPSFLDTRQICALAMSQLSYLAKNKGITLQNEIPECCRLYADSNLFGQVVLNLVSNAVKFCGEGDRISILVSPERRATIVIRDTGPGMEDYVLQNLFKHEVKTSTLGTQGERGTGLGLPLSHDIMKAHGGTLDVESKQGKGSTFYIELPHVRPRILVVDDEQSTRFLIKELLEELDVDIVEAKGGAEALKIMEKEPPHLAILDLIMPEMDGFKLLENLQNNPITEGIPTIVITSDQDMEIKQKVLRMGAGDFVAKPILAEDFIPRVRRFIA